ncbi:VOC family protein [Amycolatopsis sp.]|jgi:hypothetical protein|uniref:VOC family protein n=1 Tax=Amycolatopsis sp. TaxID=37632 RepID=UPI002DF8F11F|nr:VOC family protein [Amycolatopsis sp.]
MPDPDFLPAVAAVRGMRLYHTGIVVENLDEAMLTWQAAMGLDWAPPRTTASKVIGPDGVLPNNVRYTYSLQGPHFLELIELVDPAPYMPLSEGGRVHHLGYYVDDLRRASAELEEQGFRRELAGIGSDGGIDRLAFHYNPASPGMWIELLSPEVVSGTAEWIAAAAAERGVPFVPPLL